MTYWLSAGVFSGFDCVSHWAVYLTVMTVIYWGVEPERPVRLTICSESRLELVLLKQDLVHRLLDGREVEVRLSDDDAGVYEIHLDPEHTAEFRLVEQTKEPQWTKQQTINLKHLLSKQMVPHFPLDIPVDEITLKGTNRREQNKKESLKLLETKAHYKVAASHSPSGREGCKRDLRDLWSHRADWPWRFLIWTSWSETGSLGWRWGRKREEVRLRKPLWSDLWMLKNGNKYTWGGFDLMPHAAFNIKKQECFKKD